MTLTADNGNDRKRAWLEWGRQAVAQPRPVSHAVQPRAHHQEDRMTLSADNSITSPNSCPRCGVVLGYGPHYCPIGTQPLIPQGWLCPVCGTVNAPWKATCGGSHPQPTTPATGANQ